MGVGVGAWFVKPHKKGETKKDERKQKKKKSNFDYLWDLNPRILSLLQPPAPFLVLTMAPLMVRKKKQVKKVGLLWDLNVQPWGLHSLPPFLLFSPASGHLPSGVYYSILKHLLWLIWAETNLTYIHG